MVSILDPVVQFADKWKKNSTASNWKGYPEEYKLVLFIPYEEIHYTIFENLTITRIMPNVLLVTFKIGL